MPDMISPEEMSDEIVKVDMATGVKFTHQLRTDSTFKPLPFNVSSIDPDANTKCKLYRHVAASVYFFPCGAILLLPSSTLLHPGP